MLKISILKNIKIYYCRCGFSGSVIGFKGCIFITKSFIIYSSGKDENNNANQEIELNIEEDAEIILVTDAIVTYDTIHKAISKYGLANRIDSIYTIF